MRLATIETGSGTAAAVVRDDAVATIAGPDGAPAFADVGALLRAGEDGMALARATAAGTDGWAPLDRAALRRPIAQPGAVFCVGLNYRTHILEMGRELPAHPTLFSKLARALTDPFAEIALPRQSERVDYEGELAIVVGRGGRDVAAADAWDHVGGLCVLDDVTLRDFQKRTVQWFAGKTWEATTPFGPWITTAEEAREGFAERELRVRVNGELRQQAPLGDLVFGVPELIADISQIVELQPGDLIATGTPGGVGEAMDPRGYVRAGDVVTVEIDGLGALESRFVASC